MKKITLLIVLTFCSFSTYSQSFSNLNIKITKLRNDNGKVIVALFTSPNGFPDKREKAFIRKKTSIDSNQASISFINIPEGIYAVAFYHDENNNDEFDSNWLGIPKEGYGASNNAKGHWGPPDFEDAKIMIAPNKSRTITLTINY